MSTVTENRHVIQKTIFDIRFDSEEVAFEQHTALDELVKRRLMKVVEEAFDETVDAEQVLVLSSLEVDLGVVSYADYSREMEDRLRHRLRELLRAQYARAQSQSARDSTLVGRSSAKIAQLSHYLTHGHLPWSADDQGPQAIERLLNRVMLHDPNGLARLLRDLAGREVTIRRLVTQFPAEYLPAILKTLLPSAWSGRLAALADELAALPGAEPLPAPPFANEVMESVWSSLFRHALSSEAPAQGPEDFLNRALEDLPAKMKLMGASAWRALIAGLTRATTLDRGEPARAISPPLLKERDGFDDAVKPASVPSRSLGQFRSQNGTPRASTYDDDRQDPVFPETAMPAGVKRFLVEGIVSEAATASLRPEASEGSHEAAAQIPVDSAAARLEERARRIARNWPSPSRGLRGSEAAADGIDGPDAIHVSRELRNPNVTAEAAGGDRQDYVELPPGLLAATGWPSSPAVENAVAPPLADTRVEVGNEDMLSFPPSGATGLDGARFHDDTALTDTAFEAGPEAELTDEYAATGELMRRALQIYDDIMAKVYGVRGGAGSRGDMSRKIDELLRDSSSVLLRLYRELQSDAVLGHKLVDALSVEELRSLVFAFIAIGRQAGGGEAAELVRAIKAYSGIAAAPAGFYAHVLECLLTETVLDLEAFASSSDEFEKKNRPSAPRSDPREKSGRSLPHAGEPEGGVTDSAFDDARPRAHAQTFSRLSARTDVVRPDLGHAESVYPFDTDDRYPPPGAAGPRADQARGNFAATASFNHQKDNSTPDVSDTPESDDSRPSRAGEVSISKGIIFDDARREGRYTPYRERSDSLLWPKLLADLLAADADGCRTTGKNAVDETLTYAMDGAQAEKMPAIAKDGGCSERALIILPGHHDLILTNVGSLLLSDIFIYKTWPAPLAPELLPAFFHAGLSRIAVDDALEISKTGASVSEAGEHPPGPPKSRFYYNDGHSPAFASPLDATPQSRSSWQKNIFRETSGKRLVCLLDDFVDDGLGFLFWPSSPRVVRRGSYSSSNMSDSPHSALRPAAGTFADASWRMKLYSSRVLHGEKEILPARTLRPKLFRSPLMRDGLYGRRYKDVPHPRSPMRQAWQPAPGKMAGHASTFDSFERTLHRIVFASAKHSSRYIGAVAVHVHDPKMGFVPLHGLGSFLYPVTDLFSLHNSRHERSDGEPPDSTVVEGASGLPPQDDIDDRRSSRQAREAFPRTPIAGRSTDTAHVPYSGLGMSTHSRSSSQETMSATRHATADERDSVLTASGFVNSETEDSHADKDEADAGLVPPPDTRFSTPPNNEFSLTGQDSADEHRRVGRQGAVPMLANSPSAPSWQQNYNADLHVAHRPATLAERGENGGEPAVIERGAMLENEVSARAEGGAAQASLTARIHADYEYARTLLTQGRRPSPDETGWLAGFVEVLSSSQPDRLRQLLQDRAARRGFLEYWADSLSERPSLQILQLLRPGVHYLLFQTCDIITQACYRNDGVWGPRRINRLKWKYIFQFVLEERRGFELASIARRLADHFQEHAGNEGNRSFRSELCQRIAMNILPSTRALSLRIIAALAAGGATSDADAVLARPLPLAHGGRSDHEALGKIYIANAGLVLIASYLPRLFEAFGLTEIAAFTSPRAAERAVRLIQFMVDERTDVGEHQLVLNKLFCGVELAAPVEKDVELSSRERELMESLLRAVIANWKGIGNTSVAGLRVSFLQRQGVLHFKGEAWHLQVENKAYDMLLDSLPWSYSIIKLPWMEKMLNVDWR